MRSCIDKFFAVPIFNVQRSPRDKTSGTVPAPFALGDVVLKQRTYHVCVAVGRQKQPGPAFCMV